VYLPYVTPTSPDIAALANSDSRFVVVSRGCAIWRAAASPTNGIMPSR